jgi:3-hydroxy-3-methylglutaryl CoA synthase/uncharacterized OB-fold protein
MTSGILRYSTYLPYRRLDLTGVAPVAGGGGRKGTRTVASYDEDTTTMAVAAARGLGSTAPAALWLSTTTPAYVDKTNATAVHAALRLDPSVPAFDVNGSVRSAVGALRAAGLGLAGAGSHAAPGDRFGGSAPDGPAGEPVPHVDAAPGDRFGRTTPQDALVVLADMRTGLPGSPDEAAGGDGAAAFLLGEGDVVAELIGWGSATAEFLDRWRTPGDVASKLWEERFGEGRYVAAGKAAWDDALKAAGVDEVAKVAIVGSHARACNQLQKALAAEVVAVPAGVGFTGAAAPGLALAALLDAAQPGELVALVVLADGADVLLLRATEALGDHRSALAVQAEGGGPIAYGTYLRWRGLLTTEPPRRPEPARPSAAAAGRSADWKFGFVGSQGDDGTVHLPPSPLDETSRPMADATGTIVTFTVDRLAYSPSPPVVFAVVDFDGGGRLPVELTDVDAADVAVGGRVELTFRKLFTADGIHNYFWKARPIR